MNPLIYILQGIGVLSIGLALLCFYFSAAIQRKLAPQNQPGLTAAQRKAASWLTVELPDRERRAVRRLRVAGFLLGFSGLLSWSLTLIIKP